MAQCIVQSAMHESITNEKNAVVLACRLTDEDIDYCISSMAGHLDAGDKAGHLDAGGARHPIIHSANDCCTVAAARPQSDWVGHRE